MSQPIPLTLKQQFWLEHLRACERSGQTMKDCKLSINPVLKRN
jgi:hypothetical protein